MTPPALDCNFQRTFTFAEPIRLAPRADRTAAQKGGKAGAPCVAGFAAQDDGREAGDECHSRTPREIAIRGRSNFLGAGPDEGGSPAGRRCEPAREQGGKCRDCGNGRPFRGYLGMDR